MKGTEMQIALEASRDGASETTLLNPVKETKFEQVMLNAIDEFLNHPCEVRDDAEIAQLVASIKEQGVVSPTIVRKKDDKYYELVSGHRRKLVNGWS